MSSNFNLQQGRRRSPATHTTLLFYWAYERQYIFFSMTNSLSIIVFFLLPFIRFRRSSSSSSTTRHRNFITLTRKHFFQLFDDEISLASFFLRFFSLFRRAAIHSPLMRSGKSLKHFFFLQNEIPWIFVCYSIKHLDTLSSFDIKI